jgi:hypothetical protein
VTSIPAAAFALARAVAGRAILPWVRCIDIGDVLLRRIESARVKGKVSEPQIGNGELVERTIRCLVAPHGVACARQHRNRFVQILSLDQHVIGVECRHGKYAYARLGEGRCE